MSTRHFFDSIYRLRSKEEMLLVVKASSIDPADAADTAAFLESEWDNECLEYPAHAPAFQSDAALWAARTVYFAAQLQLYREQSPDEAISLLPAFAGPADAGAMLSADLCLRLLPSIVGSLRMINSEDPVITHLESILTRFHYAAVGWQLELPEPDFSLIRHNHCLMQLYADRVIERRDAKSAAIAELEPWLSASMGAWKAYFWNE